MFSTPVIPLMVVAGGINLSLKFLIDFQKTVMSSCDKGVAKASARAVSSIAWHIVLGRIGSVDE